MRRNGYKPEHRRESELRAGICNGIGVKTNNKRGKAERIQRIVLFLNKLSEQNTSIIMPHLIIDFEKPESMI